MTNKYLLLLLVIVSAFVVVYGVYSYYSIGNGIEPTNTANYGDNITTCINETCNTSNSYKDTDIPYLNETDNRTNRSVVAIPLEKPPFIDS